MRVRLRTLLGTLALFGCGGPVGQGTGTDSGSGTGESSTTDDPTTSGGGVCTPGASLACTCPSGDPGAQICNPDGKSLGPCVCEGSSGSDSDATSTSGVGTTDPDPTTSTATGVDTTGTTTGVDTTGPDTTTGPACDDPGPEPNDIEAEAVDLGEMPCNDEAQTFAGLLDGASDVDWFVYHGVYQDCGIIAGDPDATQVLTAGETIRMCAFAECDMGPVAIECHDGATMSLSPDGRSGCCAQGDVRFTVDCIDGSNESAQIFIRLDQGLADACVEYSVEYSYPT